MLFLPTKQLIAHYTEAIILTFKFILISTHAGVDKFADGSCDASFSCYFSLKIYFFFFLILDIDNNGFLDQKDFDCMALRAAVVEGKGECNADRLKQLIEMMRALWQEISDLADYDKVWLIFFFFFFNFLR